ncbi:AP-1 complex subunit mu-1 [Portunus trituberculatus]|uniref:AP-1 complex subunit mu-1 n=1 Tax=Portunus trituberculatus TaxID=210409 RepID=A0A5B7G3U0_PORTR|nr:AP-1 complex subunit mu-1 [Portunus trituberculatus]
MVKAKSQFKRRSTANNVEIIIPVPNDADSPKFKTSVGSVNVVGEDSEGKPPIQVRFEIPYFTTSGIQVRYLKIIEKSGYQALPWVRYITQNGDYQLRTN